jgi:Domain of unknown function (DUF4259)
VGAWGHKPFENDTAMDWAFELEDGGLSAVREALEFCADFDPAEYLDSDDGFACVAAAELIAAALDGDVSNVPESERAWLKGVAPHVAKGDALLAVRALKRVLTEPSELPGLWGEAGTSEWHVLTRALITRIDEFAD